MTVRELYETILFADDKRRHVSIAVNGGTIDVDLNLDVNMMAFGEFVVNRVMALGEDSFEFDLAMKPVRAGAEK